MFAWLMPFVLLSVTFGGCPDPSQVSCDGTACVPAEPGCCPDDCGGYRVTGSSPGLARGGPSPVLARPARGVAAAAGCTDAEEGQIEPDGCKVCVCRYNRRECIYKGCRACLVVGPGNASLTYRHGEELQSGCLACSCRDGQLDCNHDRCDECTHRGNSTLSGKRKEFGCGTCDCFDGQWTCDATCGVHSSAQGASSPLVLTAVLAVLAWFIQ